MYSRNVLVFLIIPILESGRHQIEDVRTKKILNQKGQKDLDMDIGQII